jgi:hypothetical protein
MWEPQPLTTLRASKACRGENFTFYRSCRTGRFQGRKDRIAVAVRKGIPHNHVDLPPFVSMEAIGVCITTGNSEVLLAAVYKSSGHAWDDADITEFLSFRHKSLLARELNAEHPF